MFLSSLTISTTSDKKLLQILGVTEIYINVSAQG